MYLNVNVSKEKICKIYINDRTIEQIGEFVPFGTMPTKDGETDENNFKAWKCSWKVSG